MRLVTRLRSVRERKRLTQDQVAAAAGMSRPTLTLIEAGRRSRGVTLDEAAGLCRVLGVDLCDMLGEAPVVVQVDTVP
ncbi:helix-turn-helix transcriptional regulator [Frankia sp. Cpl3]|nr:helix-turn-helix transcriptional regulator [Frankia sp. Cpl3]